MIEKWVNFKRDYLEISFLRENWVCATSPYHRRDFYFLDPVYLYGGRKLVCPRFSWKGAPSTKEHRICGSENFVDVRF